MTLATAFAALALNPLIINTTSVSAATSQPEGGASSVGGRNLTGLELTGLELSGLELTRLLPASTIESREVFLNPRTAATLGLSETEPQASTQTATDPTATPAPSTTSNSALAKLSANPVADLISLPFQNNFNFGWGPDNEMQYVLNVQPVIPFQLNEDLNIITRIVMPVVYQPGVITNDAFGLSDTTITPFLSPAKSDKFVWGVGPAIVIPSATDDELGSDQWALGPSVVGVYKDGPWVLGAILNNVWGIAGPRADGSVNQLYINPFINYVFDTGFYVVSSPIITANWDAEDGEQWVVPLGGGVGHVLRWGSQPVNLNVSAFYNVEDTSTSGEWTFRFTLSFLFPE
jgi:hypothetical protein